MIAAVSLAVRSFSVLLAGLLLVGIAILLAGLLWKESREHKEQE